MNSILKHKKNIYSQNGEDGIIEFIFSKLNSLQSSGDISKRTFIEFGAWDGKHLSNTYNLFLKGWNGIYIEADYQRFNNLVSNFYGYFDRVDCINSLVGYTQENNLDTLIERHSSKREFDFVSIDVDGLDYFIFQKMEKYLPKVICIEVNAGHSPEYPFVIPENIAFDNIGQSIKVISNLAKTKGYFPLCYTGNLFLVKNEYRSLFADYIRSLEDIYIEFLQYLGKDGVLHLYNTFVVNKVLNNFIFENEILEKFCNTYLVIIQGQNIFK